MSEFHLKSVAVPNIDSYPKTFSGFISFLANALYFDDKINFKRYVVDSYVPVPITNYSDGMWFKVNPATEAPDGIFRYTGAEWERQSTFSVGDLVLVPTTVVISSPWARPGQPYNKIFFGPSGQSASLLTAPSAPIAPAGFKYKVYVGNY